MDERFLDSLYEAAVVPELWPEVLRRFNDIARGAGAVLVAVTPNSSRWISSSAEFDQVVATHFNRYPGNERTRRLLERRHAGFLRDIDIFSDAEMANEPIYRDFLLPQGSASASPPRSPRRVARPSSCMPSGSDTRDPSTTG